MQSIRVVSQGIDRDMSLDLTNEAIEMHCVDATVAQIDVAPSSLSRLKGRVMVGRRRIGMTAVHAWRVEGRTGGNN